MDVKRTELARKVLLKRLPFKGKEAEEYLKCYEELGKAFDGIKLNNEWTYKIAGWYNLTTTYKSLLSLLLDSQNE